MQNRLTPTRQRIQLLLSMAEHSTIQPRERKTKQSTFADSQYRAKKRTRRDEFLAKWIRSCRGRVVRTDRAGVSEGGRWPPTMGLERMLRIYFLQQWFNLSDPAVEETLL